MKKILFMFMLITSTFTVGRAQSIMNTYWSVYNTEGVLTYYFHYGVDTVWVSTDFIEYFALTTFLVEGDTITVVDVPSEMQCPLTDTGRYTYEITDNILEFSVISDQCLERKEVMDEFEWVAFATGIVPDDGLSFISVFPNPSLNGIYNVAFETNGNEAIAISVCNTAGAKVLEMIVPEHVFETSIDLTAFNSGVYFLTLESSTGKKVIKLIR